ncbi:MAG: response regulator transcription factor [Anaerolineales bacterium]
MEKMNEEVISVLIVDDHTVVRDGLQALISAEPSMHVVAAVGDGIEAVEFVKKLNPDVVLMDLVMPHMDGIQATIEIKKDNPDARILILTSFAEDHQVFAAIKSGATGYLMKDSSSEELIQAIRDIYKNKPVLQPEVAKRLMLDIRSQDDQSSQTKALTVREIEILEQVALGKTNQEIADVLFVSERTVRTHITNILAKLGLSNRTQAALYALREGIAHIPYTKDNSDLD